MYVILLNTRFIIPVLFSILGYKMQPWSHTLDTRSIKSNTEVYWSTISSTGTFLWTKRGGKHPLLVLSGYTYSYQKKNADGRISWYCSRRLKGCRASAISFGTRAYSAKPHDHPPPKLPYTVGVKHEYPEDAQIY